MYKLRFLDRFNVPLIVLLQMLKSKTGIILQAKKSIVIRQSERKQFNSSTMVAHSICFMVLVMLHEAGLKCSFQ